MNGQSAFPSKDGCEMAMKEIWWAKKNPEGTYTVDPQKLLFDIILHELAIVGIINNTDEKGNVTPKEDLIKIWKALVQNLRQIPIMTVVRASYHQFYKPVRNEYAWRKGWKMAWDHAKYLFAVNLNCWERGG